jgi:hypothetical protein
MSDFKVRCSQLGRLMTLGRSKQSFGETALSLLREIRIGEQYGRWPIILNKYITKGIQQEEESLTLFTKFDGHFYMKNEQHFQNEWLTGTPDIISGGEVIDIKTSYDIWTYDKAELTDGYYWQLAGYMMLTGATSARLAYCLTSASEEQVLREKTSLFYSLGQDASNPEYIIKSQQIERNMVFDDIPIAERVKVFNVARDEAAIQQIIERVEAARKL